MTAHCVEEELMDFERNISLRHTFVKGLRIIHSDEYSSSTVFCLSVIVKHFLHHAMKWIIYNIQNKVNIGTKKHNSGLTLVLFFFGIK